MRAGHLLLVGVAVLFSSCAATSPATESVRLLKMENPDRVQSPDAGFGDNTSKRFLRRQDSTDATNDDEERLNLLKTFKIKKNPNDFARKDLDMMLSDHAFKLEMFEKWHKYSTEKILAKLNLNKKKNEPYASILEEYLNTYRKTIVDVDL